MRGMYIYQCNQQEVFMDDVFTRFQMYETDFLQSENIFYLKKIIDIYIEVFLDENLVDDHEIFDSTNILLSNYASFDLINYLKDKIKKNDNNDELKKDLFELINMVKINLQPK